MSVKSKRFIVLILADTDDWGWNEETLPMLLQIVDSSEPDYRSFTHIAVVANYFTSSKALKAVENVIAAAERLRDSDSRFARLGIGLAEGELVAEFDWLRFKTGRTGPFGAAVNDAVQVARQPNKYREVFKALRETIDARS